MRRDLRIYAAVAAGSSLGAVARHLCGLWVLELAGGGFPWGTLAVNVAGSFLIGLYATLTGPEGRLLASPARRQFVMTGFCGGFTTFSVFSLETLFLLERQDYALAAAHVGASVLLWLSAVWLGSRIGARLNRPRGA
ncbi:CrcB family protein [Cereibacter azotoformans]|uniref:Fluoride-specific ion channel FluC n=2 Tax=Cereibacter TaxID=1653176 RepID=A0A2T5JSM6_9RHOB|nr:CrcB family protein [Cereibacter azotoformans]AXQ95457.1 chromosome condensation protein CrcB [Cereibacter sphaeroides]PTR11600.1 camphor resistance protein CrcB [Cereibacter azotoformans]UIJ32305.1 CrcB family protein [Cereibacter azotoformans]ULB11772.1 CrcB family protein [Cereibacter azotoformans]